MNIIAQVTRLQYPQVLRERHHGQGLVEFALVIPILLVLMLGIIEGGRLLFIYTSLAAAGREAARYGSGVGGNSGGTNLYNDCTGIRDAAARIGSFAGVQANQSDVEIYHDTGPGATPTPYCTNPSDTASFGQGDRILVKVNANYSPIVPLVPIPSTTLHSESAHTVLLQVGVEAVDQPAIDTGGQTCDNSSTTISVSNPKGPIVTVTIKNTGSSTTISNVLVVWDTTGGPVLKKITPLAGWGTELTPNSAGPYWPIDATTIGWSFSGTQQFTITFSKVLKNNVIIRLTPANGCSFGQ